MGDSMTLDDLVITEQDASGRTYYEAVQLTVKWMSKKKHNQFEFVEMPGIYWDWFKDQPSLVNEAKYNLILTSKDNPGHNPYLDIRTATAVHSAPAAAPGQPPVAPQMRPAPPAPGTVAPLVTTAFPQVEGIVKGHVENIAVQLYIAFLSNLSIDSEPGLATIRELRDRVYHELTNQPIAPSHYCYEHEQPRKDDGGRWFHPVTEDGALGWCMDDGTFVAKDRPLHDPVIDGPSDPFDGS